MVIVYLFIPTFIVGAIFGYSWREVWKLTKQVAELGKKLEPKQTSSVTYGSYLPPSESKQTQGIVNPKSPQLIEWEAQQERMRQNLIARSVKPE
jgi:hypothetical protein